MTLDHLEYDHHRTTLANVRTRFQDDPEILALYVGGSLAHGYAKADSDVDIILIISEQDYQIRKQAGNLLFFSADLSTYQGGYVDGKFITPVYLDTVARQGNQPSRYAFKDCFPLIIRDSALESLVFRAACFPDEQQSALAERFYAQLQAWRWYFYEGNKHQNPYLIATAVQNVVLYACRIVLNHNRLLYPYHKWMLAEVQSAPEKPENLLDLIHTLVEHRRPEDLEALCRGIEAMNTATQGPHDWPNYFLQDVETPWMRSEPYIADL
ncbi:nucleotidyltransferase domain-containing protein [Spirochaeta lutea]|uniref:Polymerase beta nucleotidyltransferase domain-containing protein n=1 Tax=Spirochaeta lutea TaxID=1480694 RepID=A0A098QZ06_9SPIO|nr:nucleotidyltransferase domain-containing protein [Spirochaeta lutea]KGE72756.1 hypothetical protein DC28_05790 [Spirochaeta lutea]